MTRPYKSAPRKIGRREVLKKTFAKLSPKKENVETLCLHPPPAV
ncbi:MULTISPECIES: hypothetical protein [unclassified Nonomuraea]